VRIRNNSTGAAASSVLGTFNSASGIIFIMTSTGYSGSVISGAPSGQLGAFYTNDNQHVVIGTGATERVRIDGNGAFVNFNQPTRTSAGSAGTPSWSFLNDTDTGFFSGASNKIGVALGGAQAMQFNGVSATGSQTATFTATNKPGSGTAGPIAWLPVLTAGGTQGYIPIFGG
jgi:hypothetical protein